jgi:CxxC motif-containing protein (DUF1111 family)
MMNAISCGSCHFKDGRARPPITETEKLNGLLFRLSVPGTNAHGQSVDDPVYGGQFQDKAIEGVLNEGDVKITYEEITGSYDDGATWSLRKPTYTFTNLNFGSLDAQVLVSPRIAQQIPGLGLLENISEEDILSHADEYDADGDGISGKPNYVWDEKQQQKVLGRFGWKANQPSIAQQTAGAFNGDMGITSTLFPVDGLSQSQRTEYSQVPNGGEPEIEDESFQRVVNYIKTLSVPGRRDWKNGDVIEGKAIFTTLHCDGCHFPTTTTSSKSAISLLNNQTIHPYTDLLLHDMGEGLADNRPDFDA